MLVEIIVNDIPNIIVGSSMVHTQYHSTYEKPGESRLRPVNIHLTQVTHSYENLERDLMKYLSKIDRNSQVRIYYTDYWELKDDIFTTDVHRVSVIHLREVHPNCSVGYGECRLVKYSELSVPWYLDGEMISRVLKLKMMNLKTFDGVRVLNNGVEKSLVLPLKADTYVEFMLASDAKSVNILVSTINCCTMRTLSLSEKELNNIIS